MASILRQVVIATLLAACSFPAPAAGIGTGTKGPAPIVEPSGQPARAPVSSSIATTDESQGYAAREKQATGLQDFRGGEGYIYIGGGVLTAALLILLILILV